MSQPSVYGIDVDSATLMMARYREPGTERIANTAAAIRSWLARIAAGSRIGVESTSGYHQELVRQAQAAGHTVHVLNPRDLRHYAIGVGRRGKTDRLDAQVIARYVAKEAEHLHPYRPRTEQQHAMHLLQRQRAAVMRSITQLRQALTAHGPMPGQFTALMKAAKDAVRTLDRQIQALAKQDQNEPLYRRLSTVHGIGPVVAATLVYHLQRWPLENANAWIACTGLDPRPNDSGAKRGVRVLSKRGDAGLRQMLYLAAMTFARSVPGKALAERYRRRGLSSTATYNILARKLATIAWHLAKAQCDFDPQRFAKDHNIVLHP